MADDKFISACPAITVKVLSEEVSVGSTLRRLKDEQSFLGKKAYEQLASMLVSIPCDSGQRNPEQQSTLTRIASFASSAADFRKIVSEPRNGVNEFLLDFERDNVKNLLKNEVTKAASEIKDVKYTYQAASDFAFKLSQTYLEHTGKYLKAVANKQSLPKFPN